MNDYEGLRRILYGQVEGEFGQAQFVPVCPTCGRFVKADASMMLPVDDTAPNATCKKCGRVMMPFEGYF